MMNALPAFVFQNMDASHIDDKMDVVSSPFRQPDDHDVELDLESVPEPSVVEDDMIDYQADSANLSDDQIPDDEMVDNISIAEQEFDYNMDASAGRSRLENVDVDVDVDEDEDDILYEEEEELEQTQQQGNSITAQTDLKLEVEYMPKGSNADAILEISDDGPQDANLPGTNDSKDTIDDPATINSVGATALDSPISRPSQSNPQLEAHDLTEVEKSTESQLQLHSDADLTVSKEDFTTNQQDIPNKAIDQIDVSTVKDSLPGGSSVPDETLDLSGLRDDTSRNAPSVTLVYLDEEMSLFPPMLGDESSVYFLSDASLAFEPLDKLLAACREILTGTLDHHDELVLDIPGLGLHICEDSKYATQITLSQVLEVYFSLCNNDNTRQAQPLSCQLSSRVSLASQYSYLSSAGAEGKTYSEIVADHADTPAEEVTQIENAVSTEDPPDENKEAPVHEQEHEHNTVDEPAETANVTHEDDTILTSEIASESLETAEDVQEDVEYQANEPEAIDGPEADASANQQLRSDQIQEPTEPHLQETKIPPVIHDQLDEDQDRSAFEELHEDETNSSHTVEAFPEDPNEEEFADDLEGVVMNEDLFEKADESLDQDETTPQLIDDYEAYSDEELFAKDGEIDGAVNGDDSMLQEEIYTQFYSATNEPPSTEDSSGDASALPVSPQEVQQTGSPERQRAEVQGTPAQSPPVTPSKAKLSKRKIENEDELDFLDIDTPDAKRRRPS